MSKPEFNVKGAQALFAAAFTYAFTAVLVREVSSIWGDKAQVAARWILVFMFLMLYTYFRKTKAKIPREKLIYTIPLGITFAITVLFFTFSVQKTTIANALFTFYAAGMAASFLLGTFLLKEKVSAVKLWALGFALAGLSVYAGDLVLGSLGIFFGIIAGLAEGVSNVLRKRLAGVDRNAILRLQHGVGTVFTLAVLLISRDEIIRVVTLRGVIMTLIFAAILILAGNLLLYGYQHFDVNIGSVIMSTELVFGALLGLMLFREAPAPHELLGGALIFIGSILGSLDLDKLLRRSKRVNGDDYLS